MWKVLSFDNNCAYVQELQMWKVLSFDKNLVQFYGSCEQDGKVLLVLEYMEVGFFFSGCSWVQGLPS